MEFEKYLNLSKNNWPDFNIKWNLKLKDSLSSDNFNDTEFVKEFFSRGFLIGLINLNDLINNMHSFHQEKLKENLPVKELEDVKIAKIIYSCVTNKELLPPYITFCLGAFSIKDGWHRLRICSEIKEEKIPILISKDEKETFNKKINNIEWL